MNASAHIKPVEAIRWSKLIDEIFEAGAGYDRIIAESGMRKHSVDRIADGKRPTKHEQDQLKFLASKYVAIGKLLAVGFDHHDIDDMCLIRQCTANRVERIKDPILVWSKQTDITPVRVLALF